MWSRKSFAGEGTEVERSFVGLRDKKKTSVT